MKGSGGFGPRGHGPGHGGVPPTPADMQIGTTGADSLVADGVHTVVNGLAGDDSIAGSTIDEVLIGGAGADTLDGTAGADTLFGGQGVDVLTGGAGNDVFRIDHSRGHETLTAATVDQITDFTSGEDHLKLGHGAATASNYATSTAADFDSALSSANALFASGSTHYVAVQVGSDVLVFTDGRDQVVESAVLLVGKSLSDISYSDIG
ncbi:calcium-binding protein [Phenylobacterium sp. LjRoot225]|uniref:calcium-binding protein n=1 Tax=Phenylobacterium sp. LjRoot225 TaxID=3342285 RepID=UPI003ECD7FE9